jgi:hypothetical protein|nr:putative Ig domain-containing protein [Neorhizobium tomejilense]
MLSFLRNVFLSLSIVLTSVAPSQASGISGGDGQYIFRYKTPMEAAHVPPEPVMKDITAFYVGGIGYEFSERLPMKPEWADDNWKIVKGSLPAGIIFNATTLTFEGTPESETSDLQVELAGYDTVGVEVATAVAHFEIITVKGAPIKVDIYNHTGKYKVDQLAIPSNITVHRWENLYSPPEGVTINGPYIEGTPTKAGPTRIFGRGYNYKDEVVVTYFGSYLVEDGPNFPPIADMIYPLPQMEYGWGVHFDFGAPSSVKVNRQIDPARQPRYFVELDTGEEFPVGISSNGDNRNLKISGWVTQPYDTARVRFRALDSDGVPGFSNWFTFGSSDPQPSCNPYANAANAIKLYTGRDNRFPIPLPYGKQGVLTFHLVSGNLPDGMKLDSDNGLVSGTPRTVGDDHDFTVRIDVTNGPNTVSTECAYRVEVVSSGVKLVDATPVQDRHLRVGDTYGGTARVEGGIPSYSVDFTTPSDWPTMSFTTSTENTSSVGLIGQFSTGGNRTVPLTLSNGDGKATAGSIGFTVHDELDIGDIPTVHVKRHGAYQSWATLPYDGATVIPEVANPTAYPAFTLQNAGGLPTGISLSGDAVVGETAAKADTYGPFRVEIADFSGDRKLSNEFNIVVDPRDEIKGKEPVAPTFIADLERELVAPKVLDVIQPPGAKDFEIEWVLNGPAFDWLVFDRETGEMKALAGIPRTDITTDTGRHGPYTITATDSEGSTTTSSEFYISVIDRPLPWGKVPAFRGTAEGDVSKNEHAPRINILNLISYIDEMSVIGGYPAVTFLSAEPPVDGLVFDPAAGSLSGFAKQEFNGVIRMAFKDGRDREGVLDVPLEVRGYPRVAMGASQYELPRLSDAAGLSPPISGRQVSGFWNAPVWGWADGVTRPAGFTVDPGTGKIVGSTDLPVGSVIPDLRLKATSKAPTGETLVSETEAFSIKVTSAVPMTLSYSPTKATYKIRDLGNGRYSLVAVEQVTPTVGGSHVAPLSYTLDQAQAQSEGLKGIEITEIGSLKGSPDRLGKWTVAASVTDKEGNAPSAGAVELTIKATLAGNVESSNGGGRKILRQGEPFLTDALQVSNYVGSVKFLTSPALIPETLDFSATTGAFSDQSYFDIPGDSRIYVNALDDDDRTFRSALSYDFEVIAPLEMTSLPQVALRSKQYSVAEGDPLDVSFTPALKNVIGEVSYALEGDLPGQLVYAVPNENGGLKAYQWITESGVFHELGLDPMGKIERYRINFSDQPLPYQVASDYLPLDALVFHPKELTLRGIPSKAGTFEGIRLVAYDDHANDYIRDVATKVDFNKAKSPEIVITVDPADPLLAVNLVGADESDVESLSRYTKPATLRTEVKNAAYGRPVTWTQLAGTLPQNVNASGSGVLRYSGYPEVTGTYTGIVYRAQDAAGRRVNANDVTFVVGPRQPFDLVASANPAGFTVNEVATPIVVSPSNSAYGRSIPDNDWTVTGVANLPPGIDYKIENGRVTFSGTPKVIGQYGNIVVSARDAVGAAASVTLAINVILPTDAIVLNVSNVRTKVGYPFEMQASASNTYGKVRFYSHDISGALADWMSIDGNSGLVSGTFEATGDHDADIYVTDTTNRVTSKPVQIAVIPDLRITVPQIVAARQAEPLKRTVATDYVLGTVTYAKGAGDWPIGIDVDPANGDIIAVDPTTRANNVIGKSGDYEGLTIVGTDRFGNNLVDTEPSNAFTIRVSPLEASPVISDIPGNRMVFGTEGTESTPFTPTVKDSVKGNPWNYAGTKYSLNRALPAGLDFDEDTGTISGIPEEPVIIRDLRVKVTAQNGESDETAAFWFGVAPKDPITPTAGQNTAYKLRVGDPLVTATPLFDNAMGNLAYAKVSGDNALAVSGATGQLTALAPTSTFVAGTFPVVIKVTDEFARTGQITVTLRTLLAMGLTASSLTIDRAVTYTDVYTPTVTNAYGTKSFVVTGLPDGLTYDTSTGAISGKVSATYSGSESFSVTYTVTDSEDGTTRSATVTLKFGNGKQFWRVLDTANPGYYDARFGAYVSGGFDTTSWVTADGTVATKIAGSGLPGSEISGSTLVTDSVWSISGRSYDGGHITKDAGGAFWKAYKFTGPVLISSLTVHYVNGWTASNTAFAMPIVQSSSDGINWTFEFQGYSSKPPNLNWVISR